MRPILPFLLPLLGLLAACAPRLPEAPQTTGTPEAAIGRPDGPFSGGIYKVGQPYSIGGVIYSPAEDWSYAETGIASWYGPGFHGRPTANGERFDRTLVTAAHRTLPMPSVVRVTNLDNGRSLVVRVNDRGPFKRGRIIDLSERAATLLGFRSAGTAKVRVELMQNESLAAAQAAGRSGPTPARPVATHLAGALASVGEQVTLAPVGRAQLYVQAGAFTERSNAETLQQSLLALGPTLITAATVEGRRFYRVRVGPIESIEVADRLLDRVVAAGQPRARIVVE